MINGKRDSLVTSGNYGYIGAPTAGGHTIEQAFAKVQDRLDRVQVPNMQYRTDIEESTRKRYEILERGSWL